MQAGKDREREEYYGKALRFSRLVAGPFLPATSLTCELLGTAEISKFSYTGVSDQNVGSLDVPVDGRAASGAEECELSGEVGTFKVDLSKSLNSAPVDDSFVVEIVHPGHDLGRESPVV